MDAQTNATSLDVLIIGAGLSGLGMAHMLKSKRPRDRFAIIESRENIGGTWDLFRYPGIRSDSSMYSFAYSFKPWREKSFLGSGERIRNYLRELVDEQGLERHIRFRQRVTRADWDSHSARWKVTITRDDGSQYRLEPRFLVTCTGYYNYEKGYLPEFEGYGDFKGEIAHPQHWPQDLDYRDKQVVVIGSGATAVTVVPAMAGEAAHVTMVQRSPTYIFSMPATDRLYSIMAKWLTPGLTNRIMRAKYVLQDQLIFILSRRFPNLVRKFIRHQNRKALGGAYDVDVHFNPRYQPWDQRLCRVPDDDLFQSLRTGRASVVTDEIERFTETGILLKSGKELFADVIVPATGLDLQLWGGMEVTVDGRDVRASNLITYKGMMFSQMPNLITVFGYTNAPYTLKAELTYGYLIRLLDHMESRQHKVVYPYLADDVQLVDFVGLQSGYILRVKERLPKQGRAFPWCNKDLYFKDLFAIKHSRLNDGVLRFDDIEPLARFHQAAH